MDEDGWLFVDEETSNAVDEYLSRIDDEYAQHVIAFTEARIVLARARLARGFYPVITPTVQSPS